MISEDLVQKILTGKISLREAEKITGLDREKIQKFIQENYPNEREKFLEQLKTNKASATRDISEQIEGTTIKDIAMLIITGEISARAASERYKIDRETLKRKIQELVRTDPRFLKAYIDYTYGKTHDYSEINFKLLFIEMIAQGLSQTEIATQYEIPARTISREIEKLNKSKNKEDQEFYEILKAYSYSKMRHKTLSTFEERLLVSYIDNYRKNNSIIQTYAITEQEELEEFCSRVTELESLGMNQAQIAKEMNVGISTIKRKKLKLAQIIEDEKHLKEDGGRD